MTLPQILILAILAATVLLFLRGTWRHDMVAGAALLACVLTGLVAPAEAFAGFGHPAVITVACVLVLSRGLQTSGAVDALTRTVMPAHAGPTVSIAVLALLAAVLSGFMNNVGALALLMPVALQMAHRLELPPGKVLMPLAFGSILGGMTTLIGTPPNLIVSGFRESQDGMRGFAMFDFAAVGLPVTLVGLLFIALLGWRLVPARTRAGAASFETGSYVTEARVPRGSAADGRSLREIEEVLEAADAQVIGLVRNEVYLGAPRMSRLIRSGDILLIEADVEDLPEALSRLGLKLEEDKPGGEASIADSEDGEPVGAQAEPKDTGAGEETSEAGAATGADDDDAQDRLRERAAAARVLARAARAEQDGAAPADRGAASATLPAPSIDDEGEPAGETAARTGPAEDIALVEMAVLPGAVIAGRSASDLLLRSRHGINLLAVSRQGERSVSRLRSTPLLAGDVLLLQGPPDALADFASHSGCVPLAQRELRIPDRRRAITAGLIMLFAVGGAAFGLLPAAVSFAIGVLASMALKTVPPRSVYEAIDWPVVVLLAALIPVAGAMETTGTADLIARLLLDGVARGEPILALALVLVVTMTLSDLMNNAATAAVMCPIALGTANALGVNPDAFLMAVAIGASCAFLTPIGHQNNTLILGPGGFRFGDYWRMGLPLELLVIAVALPVLLWAWPL